MHWIPFVGLLGLLGVLLVAALGRFQIPEREAATLLWSGLLLALSLAGYMCFPMLGSFDDLRGLWVVLALATGFGMLLCVWGVLTLAQAQRRPDKDEISPEAFEPHR